MVISVEDRYTYFKNAVEKCGIYLLYEDDATIEHNLFEDFSVEVVSFLHEESLNIFLEEGLIDNDIFEKSIELRNSYLRLEENLEMRNAKSVKKSWEWREILIKSLY